MFTRFRYHWAETRHCAEFSFTWLKSFKLKRLNWAVFHCILFPLSSTVVTDWSLWSSTTSFGHWRALWPPWLPPLLEPTLVQLGELNSVLLSLTRHCQSFPWKGTTCWWPTHCAWTNWPMGLSPLQRIWHPHLRSSWPFVYHSVNYDCGSNCEDRKCTAVSPDLLPVTLVAGSMTDGLYRLFFAIPSPENPCNSFVLTTLHCRRCCNWIPLKAAETLFPSCRLPHYSYTHAGFKCFRRCGEENVEILTGTAFKGDVTTTGQTAQTMCIATTLSIAMEILNTGVIPISLFTNGQVNCWFTPRSGLLRAFQMHWTGITLIGRTNGCRLLQSLTSPFSDNCDSPPADDKFCRRVSHCRSTDSFQQALLGPLLDHWGTGRKHGTE